MDPQALEQTLRNLTKIGTLIKHRQYRQVWRFEHEGKAYFLKFYPKGGARDRFRRFFRGSPAIYEFTRLQWLQKAGVPAPRATAYLLGFRLDEQRGDVVILEAIEPSVQLDQILIEAELRGERLANHLHLAAEVCSIVQQLGKAGLGHEDLHLGNFLLHDNRLFLLDGYAVRAGGMRLRDLLMLAHSARRFATTADLQRGWEQFAPGLSPPPANRVSKLLWKRFIESTTKNNRYFGRFLFLLKVNASRRRDGAKEDANKKDSELDLSETSKSEVFSSTRLPSRHRVFAAHSNASWSGVFYKQTKYGYRWSVASRLEILQEDWQREWPLLLEQMEADELPVIKRSRSGDVLRAKITLGGQLLDVIVKRPRRRYWYRYLNEIGRGSRPYRAWKKSWHMIARGLPTAWPLLVMERRSMGYVVDAVLISELVPGETLAHANLDGISPSRRETLFRRTGHLLRLIEKFGFSHFDAKASNWIVREDEKLGPMPVMIDVDGIRHRQWTALGIVRLLRSMHENSRYTPDDSLWLCQGYAPFARGGEIGPESQDTSAVDLKIVES